MVAPRVWARQTGLLEPKDACGRVVAHSEVTSQIAQSGDHSREVAICLAIGAKCVNSSAFSGTYFCSTVASTQESTSTTKRYYGQVDVQSVRLAGLDIIA